MRYSVQSRDRIFVKVYEFLSLAENLGKNTSKDISKNLKILPEEPLKKQQKQLLDLIGNKIANRITKVSRNPQ